MEENAAGVRCKAISHRGRSAGNEEKKEEKKGAQDQRVSRHRADEPWQ